MGKNRSKKKGTKPPNPNILPFLQEMFPNIEKDIVEIVFEQNEYDEEKTMQLLSEMGDDSKPFGEFVDDINNLEEAVDNFSNIGLSSDHHSHNKNEPIIFNNDYFTSTNSTFMSTQQSPPDIPSTTYLIPKRSSKNTMSSKSPRMATSTTGETGEFLSSMFPELDPTMVSLLYEENGSDVGKTVESLLSIVFMNHSGTSNDDEEEAEALDEVENEALAEVASDEEGEESENQDYESESDEILEDTDNSFEAEDANSEDDGEEIEDFEDMSDKSDIYHQFETGEFKFDIPQPIEEEMPNETVSAASKSEFIQNLKLLAELFPETPRTLLALELDEHDGNLEKTIASCCRADPEYLQKLSGEKGIPLPLPEQQQQPVVKKTHPTPVNHILKPTWIRKGASRPDIKYVPPPPAPSTTTPIKSKTRAKTKGKTTKPKSSNVSSSNRLKPMDLAAKLKLKQLKEKFSFVDADILEAVFVQNGHKVHTTLVCLYDIYPHLRDASTSRGSPSSSSYSIHEPSSPEEPLTRTKRDKSGSSSTAPTTTTTTTTTTTATDKPRKKRTKPATAEEGEDDGDFITVSYRKKKSENSSGSASAPVTPKKVLDSDDIETTYQSYREKAVQAGEMRNHLFMQAVSAYQSGDGARAKALSNRAREYNEMMKQAHQQACYQIFNDCNARFDTLASVDLHGLHVAESLQVLSQLLDIHTQMGENSRKPKKLKVITGVGKHSVKGIAKIKPAVKNFLRSKGYKFQETDAGVITISLSR